MSRKTLATIDLNALAHNVRVLNDGKSTIIGVIKANAYGHGMLEVADALAQSSVEIFAVAFMDEAERLRHAGFTQPILILEGPMTPGELAWMLTNDCWPMLHCKQHLDWLEGLSESTHSSLKIWLKVDTGMHRLGFTPSELEALLKIHKYQKVCTNLVLATHFACADDVDVQFSKKQLEAFNALRSRFKCEVSISNSAGQTHPILKTLTKQDYVRLGISLYGCAPSNCEAELADKQLKPVMTLTAPIIALRDIAPGEGVGYGQTWHASTHTQIATVAIGYADGYPRHASNRSEVLVKGGLCPIVGRVSMDMICVDVSSVSVSVGDEVCLWGPNHPVENLANAIDTINYECVTRVSERVPRVYKSLLLD